jgi:hypothetical protein
MSPSMEYFVSPFLVLSRLILYYEAELRAGRLDDQGSNPGGGWEFFSSRPRPDWLWGPPSLLSNG